MSVKCAGLLFALLGGGLLGGQEPVKPERAAAVAAAFAPSAGEQPLACEVRPLAPELTYRLVYRAGYVITLPGEFLAGSNSSLGVLVRVTPKQPAGATVMLGEVHTPPKGAEQQKDLSKIEAQVQGGFFLGAGSYEADLTAIDASRRVCRRRWDIEVKPHKGASGALAPGHVAAFSQVGWPGPGREPQGVTILLNAGPPRWNGVLLESLAAMIERLGPGRVRVVAFSLEQHKELARETVTGPETVERLKAALESFNPATVSYGVLKNPAGHRDFLWGLLAKEQVREKPAAAVLFVGFTTLDDAHTPVPPACSEGPFYAYFDYPVPAARSRRPGAPFDRRRLRGMPVPEPREPDWPDMPPPAPARPDLPDAISRAVRACSGKVFHIRTPEELASALEKTAGQVPAR